MKDLIGYLYLALFFCFSTCLAQDARHAGSRTDLVDSSTSIIVLPAPDTAGGKPLMSCLKNRKSSRSFDSRPLPMQTVSDLLWAAFGINRPDGRRTAPSAMNWQEIDVYLAMESGLYIFVPQSQTLKRILSEDVRSKTGTQTFVAEAPVDIIYVADLSRTGRASQADQTLYTAADCGFIAQNVYLYCASKGLACVVRGSVDREELAKAIHLSTDQKVLLSQTVGYPK